MTSEFNHNASRLKSLSLLADLFDRLKIDYRLGTGALLGAIRDGDFIPWDWDVGIDIPAEDLLKHWDRFLAELSDMDFSITYRERTWLNGKIECTDGESKFELMGWRRDFLNNRRRRRLLIPQEIWHGSGFVELRGLNLKTYANPEQYLAHFYGNWQTPVRATTESDKSQYMWSSVRRRDYLDCFLYVPGWLIKRITQK